MLTLPDDPMNGAIAVYAAALLRRLEVGPRSYFLGLAILVVLMLFAMVKAYRMWEEIHDVEEPDSPNDLLETFEEAHAAGELDDEELERVRRRLSSTAADDKPSPPCPSPKENPPES